MLMMVMPTAASMRLMLMSAMAAVLVLMMLMPALAVVRIIAALMSAALLMLMTGTGFMVMLAHRTPSCWIYSDHIIHHFID